MVQVRVLGVALDASGQHIILLKPLGEDEGQGRVLPIWIGAQEATSILIAIQGEQPPRPLSHDLMKLLLDAVGSQIERVEVTRIEDGTFYAELSIRTPTGPYTIDARPSDSVALASRTGAPLFVADEVLEEAGIPAEMVEPHEETEEEKLEEFKKFLEDVDPEDFQG
jgi:bifunctional DNase/RNase